MLCAKYITLGEIDDCKMPDVRTWFGVSIALCVWNIGFSIYLYQRLAIKVREGTVASAVWKLIAYDVGVCINFCVMIFLMAWLGWGGSLRDDADNVKIKIVRVTDLPAGAGTYPPPTSGCDTISDSLVLVITLFIIFLILGLCIIALSICTECCREPRWKQHPTTTTTAAPHASSSGSSGCPNPFRLFSKKSHHSGGGGGVGAPPQHHHHHQVQMAAPPQSMPIYAEPVQLQAVPVGYPSGYPPPSNYPPPQQAV